MNNTDVPGQWPLVARQWLQLGSPLRPDPMDIFIVKAMIERWHDSAAARYLILGVTPEYHALAQAAGGSIQAIDRTPEMIRYVWPGQPSQAETGDWRQMPWQDPCFDLALCDGGLQLVGYPDGITAVARELHRVLSPDGLFIVRLFTPPKAKETSEHVLQDLNNGEIPNLNVLKLRLGMAMQTDAEHGTALRDVWMRLQDAAGPWPELARKLSWPLDHLLAIDAYRESPACMYYFTPDQAIDAFEYSGFKHLESASADYVLGNQCPTLCFRRL
jgi:SAM-dependent methyltransferase